MSSAVGHLLVEALRKHRQSDPDDIYDQVLREVSARAVAARSLGKADIGALVFWKRITAQATWARELLLVPDTAVRAATEAAFLYASDTSVPVPAAGLSAREALRDLPGMGGTGALASAVLLALAPNRMAVWDRRVDASLTALGRRPKSGARFYARYLAVLTDLMAEMEVADDSVALSPREVDLALFTLAGSPTMLAEAGSLR